MKDYIKPFDNKGNKLSVGDNVRLIRITDHLLKNLPMEEQNAIKAQKDEILKVIAFDEYGYAEIEFKCKQLNSEIVFHTIWVEPFCLKKE